MLLSLGLLAASSPTAGGSYELIETITVGAGGAASVTFSNLNTYSTTYQHLQIRALTRSTGSGSDRVLLRFNGDSGSNYAQHELTGSGSSVSSSAATSQTFAYPGIMMRSNESSGIFSPFVADVLDAYATKNKTLRSLTGNNASFSRVRLMSSLWMNTASITSISITAEADNFAIGSRFSLYGIKG